MRYLWKLHEEFERAQRKTAPPLAGDTVQAMFWNAVALRSDQVWLRDKKFGIWQSLTWRQTADQVEAISAGLIALGLAVQDRVAIISNTRAEWVLADLATLSVLVMDCTTTGASPPTVTTFAPQAIFIARVFRRAAGPQPTARLRCSAHGRDVVSELLISFSV